MALDPRLVIQVLAIAQHGSISRAAEAIGLSQPALSNSIANLERTLGVRVLERTRQGSKLTDFGITVSRCAGAMNSAINTMMDEVRAKLAGNIGPLTIGATPIAAATLVPQAVTELMQKMPNLELSIIEGADDMLLDLLTKAKIELSVGPIGVDTAPASIAEIPLRSDPFAIVVRRGHALSSSKPLSLKNVVCEQWVLPDSGSAYRRHVEALFLTAGIPIPTNSINTNSRTMMEEILLRTDRISIMSRMLISQTNCANFVCIPLKEAGTARLLGIKCLRHIDLSPPAISLIEILKKGAKSETRHRFVKSIRKAHSKGQCHNLG